MMIIVVYIVLGAVVGWLASVLLGRKQGIVLDVVTGIVGALIGDGIMQAFGGPHVSGLNLPSFLVALIGAIIFLFMLDLFRRASRKQTT